MGGALSGALDRLTDRCPVQGELGGAAPLSAYLSAMARSADIRTATPDPLVARDTSPGAERVRVEAIRRIPPAQRLRDALELSEQMRRIVLAALRMRFSGETDEQLLRRWVIDAPAERRSPARR